MKKDILIVDDDIALATQLKWALKYGYNPSMAHTAEDAEKLIETVNPGIVLLDLGLPPEENTPDIGLRLLKNMIGKRKDLKVIVLTGQRERGAAVGAISSGAFDYLVKPVGEETLLSSVRRAEFFIDIESDISPDTEVLKITRDNLGDGFETLREEMKRHIIEEALINNGDNVSQTARLLGLRRTSVYYYINKYNLRPRDR